jgi:hypothetical protein
MSGYFWAYQKKPKEHITMIGVCWVRDTLSSREWRFFSFNWFLPSKQTEKHTGKEVEISFEVKK